MSAAEFRPLRADDVDALLALFERVPPSIAHQRHRVVFEAAILDALAGRRLLIVVAEREGRLVGYSILAWDWHRFRRAFVLRHPRVATLLASAWLRRKLRRRTRCDPERPARPLAAASGTGSDAVSPKGDRTTGRGVPQWNDGGSHIAKVLYTGVHPEERSQGIGSGLKSFYVARLRRMGIRRIDASMTDRNQASLAMQRRHGWTLVPHEKGTFAYMEVDDRQEGSP